MLIVFSFRDPRVIVGLLGLIVATTACSSSDNGGGETASGGTTSVGGSSASGGSTGTSTTGGSTSSTGGSSGVSTTGGSTSSTGGATSTGTVPTWTDLYADYFAAGTAGDCVLCHTFGATKASLYSTLQSNGQINGTSSPIVTSSSILTWFGGTMPQGGSTTNPAAVDALNAWVAAGALNN